MDTDYCLNYLNLIPSLELMTYLKIQGFRWWLAKIQCRGFTHWWNVPVRKLKIVKYISLICSYPFNNLAVRSAKRSRVPTWHILDSQILRRFNSSFFEFLHSCELRDRSLFQPHMISAVFFKIPARCSCKEKPQLGNIFTSLGHILMSNASPVRQTVILPEVILQRKKKHPWGL